MSRRSEFVCKASAVLSLTASLGACADLQGLEPIDRPPPEFQRNTVVPVEFVGPAETGFRCAQRGATFWGLPALNAGACATETLVTMPNPCEATTGGWYAALLCHEIGHRNGWRADHPAGAVLESGSPRPLPPASQSPEAIAYAQSAALGGK